MKAHKYWSLGALTFKVSVYFFCSIRKRVMPCDINKKSDWMRSRPIGFLFIINMVLIFQSVHTPLCPVQNLPEVFHHLFHPAFWHTGLPDPCMV